MKKPFLVGIAGGSASGKSTASELLERKLTGLRVKTLHMDSYFKPEAQRPYSKAMVSGKMYIDDNHPDTMNLAQLKVDLDALVLEATHDVLIIEGLLTLYDDAINDALDFRLFVECRPDERIVRRLKRNMQWGLSFDEISNVYLDMVRHRHDQYVEPSKWRADLILNGSSISESGLQCVAEYIRAAAVQEST